jgi:pyruvate dehydrogenase E2 component (dihydrolipoamide acetyltransferase)
VALDGQIVVRKIMPLSLAFDHRVIDGVEAGRFLNVVIQHLERPDLT